MSYPIYNTVAATLRLFNAIYVPGITKDSERASAPDITKGDILDGYIVDPRVPRLGHINKAIEDLYGLGGVKLNSTFRKNWNVIRESSQEELMLHQLVHYFTTYGFEALGIYSEGAVYFPADACDIPEIDVTKFKFTFISAINKAELINRINVLGNGIALSEQVIKDIMTIVMNCELTYDALKTTKNRELQSQLVSYFGVTPAEPNAFVRFMVTELTGTSLVIKNYATIEALRNCDQKLLARLLREAPDNLAQVFYRYKPLFLAMRKNAKGVNRSFFNRLRKQAKTMHKPMKEDFMGSMTGRLKNDKGIPQGPFVEALLNSNPFRKIRLLNALAFRMGNPSAIMYRIRNGKGFVTEFTDKLPSNRLNAAFRVVHRALETQLAKNFEGKTFYIPEGVNYAMPATEKQFSGNLPVGTFFEFPEDCLVGVHWTNTDARRVDLDLSVITAEGKIGWDAAHKAGNVMFSGDVTDAPRPNGATEFFLYENGPSEPGLFMVNDFNRHGEDIVPAKVIIAKHAKRKHVRGEKYIVDPNNVIATANIAIEAKQSCLGLVTRKCGMNRFYLSQSSIGRSISTRYNDQSRQIRAFMAESLVNMTSLNDFIESCGGTIVNEIPEEQEVIDLSPENLTKDSFIELLTPMGEQDEPTKTTDSKRQVHERSEQAC